MEDWIIINCLNCNKDTNSTYYICPKCYYEWGSDVLKVNFGIQERPIDILLYESGYLITEPKRNWK